MRQVHWPQVYIENENVYLFTTAKAYGKDKSLPHGHVGSLHKLKSTS